MKKIIQLYKPTYNNDLWLKEYGHFYRLGQGVRKRYPWEMIVDDYTDFDPKAVIPGFAAMATSILTLRDYYTNKGDIFDNETIARDLRMGKDLVNMLSKITDQLMPHVLQLWQDSDPNLISLCDIQEIAAKDHAHQEAAFNAVIAEQLETHQQHFSYR